MQQGTSSMKTPTLSICFLVVSLLTSFRLFASESFIMLDPADTIIAHIGDTDTQLSPCSTFKIALSLIGYDMHILTNEQIPKWDSKEKYDDFLPTLRTATPVAWMKNSCVWYSQSLALLIGEAHMQDYLAQFDYGNQDFSGDPGKNNGLTNAWLSSSLKISPLEQARFLQKIIHYSLPISRHAIDTTKNMLFIEELPHGWKLFGKTGLGRIATTAKELGWLIGWIEKNGQSYPFAFAIQDTIVVPSKRIIRVKQLLDEHLFKNKAF